MKKELLLEGLHCASCATEIEKHINRLAGVSASLNFMTKTLSMDIDSGVKIDPFLNEVKAIIKGIEPDVVAKDKEGAQSSNRVVSKSPSLTRRQYVEGIGLIAGVILFVCGLFVGLPGNWPLACFLLSYLLIGGKVILQAGFNMTKGRVFDENLLMGIATIGAFAIGEYPEGVAVMLFYRIGETFQDMAVNRSRRSISALMDIRPDVATLQIGDDLKEVHPQEVQVGEMIVVKPGERIPLDGCITSGSAALDVSALTGESLPREVSVGEDVLAGSINTNGVLSIQVSKVFGESTLAKILDLVENAGNKKASTENFITKFARYYTPIVVAIAALLATIPPLIIPGALFADWLYRALVFLVVSCPCALVISIPMSFFAGIGAASRQGILIKGSNYLEALNDVTTVVFDKTGTLTEGVFSVVSVDYADGFSQEDVLRYAAHGEWFSKHPIALSIQKAFLGGVDSHGADSRGVDPSTLTDYQEIPGYGVRVLMDGKVLLAGNGKLMDKYTIPYTPSDAVGSVVYLAVDHAYAGCILVADKIKKDSRHAIAQLRSKGVTSIAMLTGDNHTVASDIAEKIDVSKIYADLLPHQKVECLEEMRHEAKGGKIAFVGDGINDAPALAISDIGIAMGGLGSDAAIEAADIVLMTDELTKVGEALRIARKTRVIVGQNIVFALGVKVIIMLLGALGIASMWLAVFADVGVALIAIMNAMRCLR